MGIRTSWTPSGTETKTIGPPKIIRTRNNQTKNTNWAERKRPIGPKNKTKATKKDQAFDLSFCSDGCLRDDVDLFAWSFLRGAMFLYFVVGFGRIPLNRFCEPVGP
jgi:hypothetical protein